MVNILYIKNKGTFYYIANNIVKRIHDLEVNEIIYNNDIKIYDNFLKNNNSIYLMFFDSFFENYSAIVPSEYLAFQIQKEIDKQIIEDMLKCIK